MTPATHRYRNGQTITSGSDPAVRITVDESLAFQGFLQFPLYGVAAVQAFVFAASDHGSTDRCLVVQFEEFLDTNDHVYHYDQAQPLQIAGLPFVTDTLPVSLDPLPPAESDTGRIIALLQENGAPLVPHVLVRRFVHFPDRAHRKELLVQYAEARGEHVPDADGLLERALGSFVIATPPQQPAAGDPITAK